MHETHQSSPQMKAEVPPTHLEALRHSIYRDEDRLVNMRLLQDRLKNVANQKSLENIYKRAVQTMRDGLLEYMRVCLEELLEVGHSQRYLNLLATRNTPAGTVEEYRCMNQRMDKVVQFQTICIQNPRVELENAFAEEQKRDEYERQVAE